MYFVSVETNVCLLANFLILILRTCTQNLRLNQKFLRHIVAPNHSAQLFRRGEDSETAGMAAIE